MQQYVYSKALFLETRGFDVVVFNPGNCIGNSIYADLNKYICGGNKTFLYFPDQFSESDRQKIINSSLDNAGITPDDYEKIFIESHYDKGALWGEVFAKELHAKHYFSAINEIFRGPNKYYEKYMDFFIYKFKRNEINGRVKKLFEGYLDIEEKEVYESWVCEKWPIENVINKHIEQINHDNCNIGIISRGNKEYISGVIDAIGLFCDKNIEKQFQVIFVGDYACRYTEICEKLLYKSNVKVYLTGSLLPIPKQLFKKLDVVLANSSTAIFSAYEKVPVIVLNHLYGECNGIMGGDCSTEEFIYLKDGKKTKPIVDVLSDVLIRKKYTNFVPALPPVQDEYSFHDQKLKCFYENYPCENDYYVFPYHEGQSYPCDSIVNIAKKYKYMKICAKDIQNANILVFGAGNEGKACLKWLRGINSRIIGVMDSDESKQNKFVDGFQIKSPDYIKEMNGDFVVIIANANNYFEMMSLLIDKYAVPVSKCLPYRYIENWPMISLCY